MTTSHGLGEVCGPTTNQEGLKVMTWLQPVGTDGHGFHIALPNTPAGAVEARKLFIRFIEHLGLHCQFISDVEAVVGEALANAAEHGFKLHGTIRVDAWISDEYLECQVADDGTGFLLNGPLPTEHPVANSARGYGLYLMQALVDQVEFRDGGKAVWFRKRLSSLKE